MYSIEVFKDGDNCTVILLKDGHEVPDLSMKLETPVEIAFRVRELVEHYL